MGGTARHCCQQLPSTRIKDTGHINRNDRRIEGRTIVLLACIDINAEGSENLYIERVGVCLVWLPNGNHRKVVAVRIESCKTLDGNWQLLSQHLIAFVRKCTHLNDWVLRSLKLKRTGFHLSP